MKKTILLLAALAVAFPAMADFPAKDFPACSGKNCPATDFPACTEGAACAAEPDSRTVMQQAREKVAGARLAITEAQKTAKRQQRLWDQLDNKTKTKAHFVRQELTPTTMQTTIACDVLLLDYDEQNSFGNATIALTKTCLDSAYSEDAAPRVNFHVFLDKLGKNKDGEVFMYDDSFVFERNTFPEPFRAHKVTIQGKPVRIYTFLMPVTNPAVQAQFRALFPNKKAFITVEQAALALPTSRPTKDYTSVRAL